jgi:hypothetical protein
MKPTYFVYVSDRGNIFMTEIAAVLAAALSDLECQTVFPAPGLPEPGSDRINLVVAPHEFFPLQSGFSEREIASAATSSVVVGVEQPGTSWFELGAHYSGLAAGVLDINRDAVDELRRRGLDAIHLKLGYHSSWDRWGGDPARPRPTDLLFLGSATPRRERVFSQEPILWDCSADIRLFEPSRPMREPRGRFVASTDKWDLMASSRVLLNIHRDTNPYFEWLRVLEAMANGCMVLTECSTDYGPLLPGKHLLAVPYDTLSAYAVSIIADEDLRSEIATAAYDLVRSELKLTNLLEPVCAQLEDLVLTPRSKGVQSPVQPPPPGPPPAPSRDALAASLIAESQAKIRVRAKRLLDSETVLIQQVDALSASFRHGDRDYADTFATGAWEDCHPHVSVILTSYNYEKFITETIDSVMSSVGVALELIVIDDRSDDASVSVVQQVMSAHDWFPMMLMARAANVGQSLARNMGIARSRGEFVFILDSDNAIYPTTLRKLSDALERAPDAAFAYGIIAKSDRGGLLSQFPWDLEHLCHGNYIDAMTMLRRSVLDEVGGLRSFWGWEDYELWCRLASNGHHGEFIPEIVAWYRVHSTNALHTTNLDIVRLIGELHRRYPSLPWSEG